jgi:hypothetical protein
MTMPSDDEVCITCGHGEYFMSLDNPHLWFCQECGTPSAKTQELLDREEPGNWS